MSVLPDGRRAISASRDGPVRLWELPGGITIELPYPNQYRAADFFKTTYPMIGLSKTAKWHELIKWISTLK